MSPKPALAGRFDVAVEDFLFEVVGRVHFRTTENFPLRRPNRRTARQREASQQQDNRGAGGTHDPGTLPDNRRDNQDQQISF